MPVADSTHATHTADQLAAVQPGTAAWSDLLQCTNGVLALALTGGVALYAVNVHVVSTVLPSVVRDIGGLDFYAWNTTLFEVASIVGAALSVRVLSALGPRGAYLAALAIFALGSAVCAAAPSVPWMLAGRSVQGLGGGTLGALSYALIRVVFAPPLWPRAVALVSGMWGVATLCGPALGGLFAEAGHWRWAFWTLLPLCVLQALLVATRLKPHAKAPPADSAARVPGPQIALLASSVMAVAAGSLSTSLVWQAAGAAAGLILGAAAIAWERRTTVRLLPKGATALGTALGAVYASVALLLVGTTTEIFVPYFLQTLHGHTPLAAGYLAAAMAGGWSLGSLLSSGHEGRGAARLLHAGPALCSLSLLVLSILMPLGAAGLPVSLRTLLCGLALAGVGAGVGICWPHLLTRVLTLAPPGEGGAASAAITTVQLYGMATGAAVAGLVANAAGLLSPGGVAGAQSASAWLFASFALAPALVVLLTRRITKAPA